MVTGPKRGRIQAAIAKLKSSKKIKTVTRRALLTAAFATAVAAGGHYGGKSLYNRELQTRTAGIEKLRAAGKNVPVLQMSEILGSKATLNVEAIILNRQTEVSNAVRAVRHGKGTPEQRHLVEEFFRVYGDGVPLGKMRNGTPEQLWHFLSQNQQAELVKMAEHYRGNYEELIKEYEAETPRSARTLQWIGRLGAGAGTAPFAALLLWGVARGMSRLRRTKKHSKS